MVSGESRISVDDAERESRFFIGCESALFMKHRAFPLVSRVYDQWNRKGAGGGVESRGGTVDTTVPATLSPILCLFVDRKIDVAPMR